MAPEQQRYPQQLNRALGVLGNIGITLSGVTPAASLYVIAAAVYRAQGSGAVWSMLLAAVLGLCMALSFAELGAAMPFAGGWYYHCARALGRPVGFTMFIGGVVLPDALFLSTFPLGAGEYLQALLPGISVRLTAVVIVVLATAVATLTIRVNEFVTGAFLLIELVAVLCIAVLGFTHMHQPLSILLSPQISTASGPAPATVGVILAGVATAMYAYNGYDGAICYAEETRGPSRGIAKAILWAFALSVATQFIPLLAGLLGAPSLQALAQSPAPMSYLIRTLGGETLNTAITLALVLAIVNAQIAITLGSSRQLFGAARDELFPEPVSRWFAAVHPRWHSPWIATLVMGALSATTCLLFDVSTIVDYLGGIIVVWYGLIAMAALVSRRTQRELPRPWRMPWWPLPPLIALGGLVLVARQLHTIDLAVVGGLFGGGALYYVLYLFPRRATKGVLREPASGDA